jgi:hypothetical protein
MEIDNPLQSLIQSGLQGVTLNDNASPAENIIYSSLKTSSSTGGTTPYVVSSTGPYTTIQSAMAAASAAGGGVVYVKPGVYAENLTLLKDVVVEGSFADLSFVDSIQNNQSVVLGTHTLSPTTAQIAFKNIVFGPDASTSNPIFTMSPTVTSLVEFENCSFSTSLNSGTPSAVISAGGSGSLTLTMTGISALLAPGPTGDIFQIGNNCVLNISNSTMFNLGSGSCITILSGAGTITSNYNRYESSGPCIKFTSNANYITLYDTYSCTNVSGYYIAATGSFGSVSQGVVSLTGLALDIDPQVGVVQPALGSLAVRGNVIFSDQSSKLIYVIVANSTAAGDSTAGTVPLVGGTATVQTTSVTANSLIRLTCQGLGTVVNPSALCVTSKVAGTSFTIKASQNTDTSTIFWEIIN